MITRDTLVERILTHLNGRMTEHELVAWAEDALLELTESDAAPADEAVILDVLMYIAAGDSPGFPLTWEVLSNYLARLGTRVQVIPQSA